MNAAVRAGGALRFGAGAGEHAQSRVSCMLAADGQGRWLSMRDVLPLVPPELSIEEAVVEASRQLQHQTVRTADQGASSSQSSSRAASKRPAEEALRAPASQPKRRKRVKIVVRDGIVVWDRNLELIPPVAYVLRGHRREAQPRPNCVTNSTLVLELERVPVGPPSERRRSELEKAIAGPPSEHTERHISEVAEFTELLDEIWDERRPRLPVAQREETEAVVCAALVQRLKLATQLSAQQMWAQAMGDAPCPVLDDI